MASDIGLEDYELLCGVAREFNEYVPTERARSAAPSPSDAKGDRPGDDFNRRASWSEILEPHGWKPDHTAGEVTYWTRPGKSRGTSATTGRCKTEGSGDLLYVFTGNAGPFEMDAAYSKFAALSVLEFDGDYAAAAKALRGRGFGCGRDPATVVFGTPAAGGDGVAPDLDFATNEDLERLDIGLRWVWDKWLQAAAVNLIAAEGGMGKTRFVADLCRRVNLGLSWPDGTPAGQWGGQYIAMWVAGDRNHNELLTLSKHFGFGARICYSGSKADPLGGVDLNTLSEFGTLYRRVKAAKPLFLVVDTAGGATSANLAKQEDARGFFAPLSDLAVKLNVCVLVITHLNATKNVLGKRAEERVRTVTRMTAADRKAETLRRIEVLKSNSVIPPAIGMRLQDAGSEYTDDPPPPPDQFGQQNPRGNDDPSRGPPTKVRECMDWLVGRITQAPEAVGKLREEAEHRGFSAKVLYTARTTLNLAETESKGRKFWALRARELNSD